MSTWKVPSLRDALADVPDSRQAQGRRYELLPVLLLCCVAVMCGARSQAAIAEWGHNYGSRWLSRLGIRRRRGPSQPTLHRIFKALDGALFERCVTRWSEQVLSACAGTDAALEVLSLDGKSLRGSARQGAAESHLLGAVSQRLGVVVAQLAVLDKSHEAAEIESLLASLVLEGRVVTCDALHTHAAVARAIIAGGGHYLLPVKDNQPVLRQDIALVFAHADELADTMTEAQTTDQHGGHIETRRLRASTALEGYLDWPGHKQVLELRRTVTRKRTARGDAKWRTPSRHSDESAPPPASCWRYGARTGRSRTGRHVPLRPDRGGRSLGGSRASLSVLLRRCEMSLVLLVLGLIGGVVALPIVSSLGGGPPPGDFASGDRLLPDPGGGHSHNHEFGLVAVGDRDARGRGFDRGSRRLALR